MKRKVLSVLLCAGLAVSMLVGCGSDSSNANKKAESTGSDLEYVKDKGTLVVGVTDFEPMDYKDDNGEWVGFDADMAKAFAESIGYQLFSNPSPVRNTEETILLSNTLCINLQNIASASFALSSFKTG